MSSIFGYGVFVRQNPTLGMISVRNTNGTMTIYKQRRKFRCFVDKWLHLYLTINHNKLCQMSLRTCGAFPSFMKMIPAIRAVNVRGLIWVRIHFGKWVFHLYRADAGCLLPIDAKRFGK